MARRHMVVDLCDDCIRHNIPDVPAVCNHLLSIDGGPARRLQLCQRCEIVWKPFFQLYEHFGQLDDPPVTAVRAPAKKTRAKAVKPRKPKALEKAPEPAPAPEDARPPIVAEAPVQEELPPQPEETKPVKEKQFVWCPLPHKSDGQPRGVNYNDRNSHADMLHDHSKLWQIPWQDKYGIFPRGEDGQPLHACDVHAECMKIGLAFTTESGLRTHRKSCPLPRIDAEVPHAS